MKRDFQETLDGIEHDHTRLDVLFEDLGAMAALGLQSLEDPTFLEDAQSAWQLFHEELASHLYREERGLFSDLAKKLPEWKAEIDGLIAQHVAIRRQLQGVAQALGGSPETLGLARASFDHLWRELAKLWAEHSAREWDMLTRIRTLPGFTPGDG